MRKCVALLMTMVLLVSLAFSQDDQGTAILSDRGAYRIDYSDLNNLRWAFERSYHVVIGAAEDIAFLKFVSLSVDLGFNEEMVDAAVTVSSPGGKKVNYKKSDFEREPYSVEIVDYTLEVQDLQVGDTLTVAYSTIADLSNRLHRWDFQYAYPVRSSELSFLVPDAFTFAEYLSDERYLLSKVAISEKVSVSRSQRLQLKGIKLACTDIPAYVEEALMPPLTEIRPAYFFSLTDLAPVNYDAFLADWSTQVSDLVVNDYWGKQFRVRSNYGWLLQEAREIMKLRTDERTKAWKCYQLVHRLFKWDGSMGVFPSHTINEMKNTREVNKAAMNQALLALLREADLRSFPILVSTRDQNPVQEEIPDVYQFNHFVIVVGIGDDALYLDAGDPKLPIGYIDQNVRRSPSALIRNYKASWVSLPEFESSSMFRTDIKVLRDGSAQGTITCSYQGYDAQAERQLLSEDKQAQYWKSRAAVMSPSIRIDSVRFSNVSSALKPLSSTVHFHIQPSDEIQLAPLFYSFFSDLALPEQTRQNVVQFPFKINENFALSISYPEDIIVSEEAAAQRYAMEQKEVYLEYIVETAPGSLDIRCAIKVNEPTMLQSKYSALQNVMAEIQEKLAKRVIVSKR
ncbi:MAG: DUF3857 domain-containing protein [Saprospiraceae bacterium]|nr:DUF3857 domain-containing protein [Saprospiraceae bacterium]